MEEPAIEEEAQVHSDNDDLVPEVPQNTEEPPNPKQERQTMANEDTWQPSEHEEDNSMPDCFERTLKMLFKNCRRNPPASYRTLSDLIDKVRKQHFISDTPKLEKPEALEMSDFLVQLKEVVEAHIVGIFTFDIQRFLWLVE